MAQKTMEVIAESFGETVSDTALALSALSGITATQVATADECWIQVVSGELNWKIGSTPTTSEGWPLTPADGRVPFAGNTIIRDLQLIREGSTDAVIHVGLYSW